MNPHANITAVEVAAVAKESPGMVPLGNPQLRFQEANKPPYPGWDRWVQHWASGSSDQIKPEFVADILTAHGLMRLAMAGIRRGLCAKEGWWGTHGLTGLTMGYNTPLRAVQAACREYLGDKA